jgi:hypothetical protein
MAESNPSGVAGVIREKVPAKDSVVPARQFADVARAEQRHGVGLIATPEHVRIGPGEESHWTHLPVDVRQFDAPIASSGVEQLHQTLEVGDREVRGAHAVAPTAPYP